MNKQTNKTKNEPKQIEKESKHSKCAWIVTERNETIPEIEAEFVW